MSPSPPAPTWTATEILERAWRLARDNFPAFITVALVFQAAALVVGLLSLGLLAGLVQLLGSVATAICLTWGTFQAVAGRKPGWDALVRRAQAPLFGRLLLLGCVQYLAIAVSAILVLPPFFLAPLWAVTIPAMMVERLDLGAAFWRSADLTAGRRLRVLGTFLLWFGLFVVGAAAITLVLGTGGLGQFVLTVYGAAAGIVLHPIPALLYLQLRAEKEGVSAGQIARAVAQD
ncbi:MAG: hypothetical protein U1E23_10060 [Reyranellaceae bacterium]